VNDDLEGCGWKRSLNNWYCNKRYWYVTCVEELRKTTNRWLTPWSTVVLEKLIIAQLVEELPAFYGNRRFIIVFTRKSKNYLIIHDQFKNRIQNISE
jgi:hypothetical protein